MFGTVGMSDIPLVNVLMTKNNNGPTMYIYS